MITNTFTPQFAVLICSLFFSMTIHTMCHQVYAQEKTSLSKARYIVEVDSQVIKATPYEITFDKGKEIHHDENVEWYTDMKIYRYISKEIDENGSVLRSNNSLKPTIFLLSGGAFTKLDNQPELKPGDSRLHNNVKLAKKLTNGGLNNVIWIEYEIETDTAFTNKIDSLFIPLGGYCYLNNTEAKARLEHASLKAFKDLRNELFIEINKPSNYVDPNNVFISGISAGAILTIYSVFLDQSEIPTNISFVGCNGNTTSINTELLATGGYPMPSIKGIIPMAGGSFYSNIFNKTTHSENTSINLMHGTCDELLNQNFDIVSYKFYNSGFSYNNSDAKYRYPIIYGSKYVYDKISTNHDKIGYGQIINGGHTPLNLKIFNDVIKNGGWDIINSLYSTPPITPNMSLPINQRDIIYESINSFMQSSMGVSGFSVWEKHSYSLFPDEPTSGCLLDDQSLLTSPIILENNICSGVDKTASIDNAPSWTSITWSVSSNLQIVGSNTGTSITYKGLTSGTGSITAIVSYGSEAYKKITLSKSVNINPTPTISGNSTLCSGSTTFTINNLPSGSTINLNITPSGIVSHSTPSGNTFTVSRVGSSNGTVNIKATIEACGQIIELTKNLHIGGPKIIALGEVLEGEDPLEGGGSVNTQCYLNLGAGNKQWNVHTLEGHTSVTWTKIMSTPATGSSILWSGGVDGFGVNHVNVHFRFPTASITLRTNISNSCGDDIVKYYQFASNGTQCSLTALANKDIEFQEVDYYDAFMSYQSLIINYKEELEQKAPISKIIISDKMGNIILEKQDETIIKNRIEIDMSRYKSDNYFVVIQYEDGNIETQQIAKF